MKLKLLILSKLMQRLLRILYKIIIPPPLQNAFTKHESLCVCVFVCVWLPPSYSASSTQS